MMSRKKHPALLREVVVNLDDGQTAVRGILFETRGDWLILRNCQVVPGDGSAVPADGELMISVDRVLYLQAVGG